MRQVVVTTLAAATAWTIGSLINNADALVASILVLVTLRVSLHASMNEAIGQILGVGIGIAVAFGASETFGVSALSVVLVVFVALLTSKLLGLGEEGAVNIAITSLIVLGPGAATDTAVDRLIGTMIGVTVAVAASYFMQSSTPLSRTTAKVAQLHTRSATLLGELSKGLRFGYTQESVTTWLAEARAAVSDIPELRSQSYEAIRYARWSPLAQSEEAEAAHARHIEAEHIAVQVRTISRTLYDIYEKRVALPFEVRSQLADALHAVTVLVTREGDAVATEIVDARGGSEVVEARDVIRQLSQQLVNVEDPSVLTFTAAIVSNIERIIDTLDGSSSALTDVPVVTVEPDRSEKIRRAVRRKDYTNRKRMRLSGAPDRSRGLRKTK